MKKFMLLLIVVTVTLFGNTGADAKSSGLVGYWTFDGSNANDFTGNHNGTVVGSGVTFPAGKVGNAVNFSVGTSFIRIPSFNTNYITVEAWVNSTKYGYYTSMVTKNYYASQWSSPWTTWSLWFNENSANPGTIASQWATASPEAVSMNQWHHLAFTYDGTTAKMYVNGVEKSSTAGAGGPIAQTAGNIYIGKPEFANHSFTGSIDEVAIWDNALPGTDILKHYQNGLLGLGYILAPTVATDSITNVGIASAVTGGNITSDGGSNVTARGVCWNTTGNPTTADFKTEDGAGTGVFTSTMTGLSAGTTYHVRAYSVNAIGTSYGDEISFTTTSYFTSINAGLENVDEGSAVWGDYDNDGDLDILLTGYVNSSRISLVYENNSGTFNAIYPNYLDGVHESSVAWGDYDNDGDLDILMTGYSYEGFISRIYNNEDWAWGSDWPFYPVIDLEGVRYSSVDWGDYDNDGDLDILLTGAGNSGSISRIYRNDSGAFTDINAALEGVSASSAVWGDYDNDGDLDILLTGAGNSGVISRIYRNDPGTFTDVNAGLEGVWASSAAWGDYDNDGDLDILLTGNTGSAVISKIYRNNSGAFTDINAGLEGVYESSVAWGDYDNDGDLDILLTGGSSVSGHISRIYRNDSGTFTAINTGLEGVMWGSAAWGDYDNDGDLDILLTGMNNMGVKLSQIYKNNCVTPNTVPSAPSNLSFDQDHTGLYFSYDPATDAETSSAGLSYNIDIDIGDGIIKTASSDLTTGYKRVPSLGNIQQNTSWTLNIEAPPETIPQQLFDMIWKVQAVDNCFKGSAFASKNDIVMTRDLVTVPKETMVATDALTWEYYMPADSVAGYTLQLSGDSLFTDCFEAFMPKAKDNKAVYIGIDLVTLGVTDSLENNGKYFWRVKPEHVSSIENPTGFKKVPDSFIYDPIYSAPSPVSIAVEGNYVTLTWGTGKDAEKGMLYNIYSSDNPYAVFPTGWTLVNSVTGTSYVLNSSVKKKFYCVTAAGTSK
jgi:hypothetical protein